MQTSLYLGVDVAQASLAVAYASATKVARLSSQRNDEAGWAALAAEVSRHNEAGLPVHLIVEPTGGYEAGLVAFGHGQGWAVSVVNPLHVRRFAQSQGRRAKTDPLDAEILARYGRQLQPLPQLPMAADAADLEALQGRRDDVVKLLRAERNRLAQLKQRPRVPRAVQQSVERLVHTLEEELAQLDEAIAHLCRHSEQLRLLHRLLLTVPGVGQRVVIRLLVLIHRFQALTAGTGTAAQLVAYLGLDPQPYESGRSVQRRSTISRMGHRLGRADLFMAALGGVRGHNPLRHFYQRLLDNGKAKRLALVACARKILVWAWAVFQARLPFDPVKAMPATS